MTLTLFAVLGLTTPLSGRLLEADGHPAANAKLFVVEGSMWNSRLHSSLSTDAQGRFQIPNPPAPAVGMAPALLVKTRTGLIAPVGMRQFAGNETTVTLPASARFHCLVVGRDHRPIRGMAISLESLTSSGNRVSVPPELRHVTQATTDARGYLTFQSLPLRSEFVMFSVDPRYALRAPRPQYMDGKDSVAPALYAERAGAITGRVKPAGLGISIVATDWRWMRRYFAKTDKEGRYRITGLMPGAYRVEVRPTQRKMIAPAVDRLALPIGETVTGIDFRLERAVAIRGQVTGVPSGKPLPHVSVRVFRPGWPDALEVFTDAHGRYDVAAMPGPHRILIGYALEKGLTVGGKGSREDFSIPDPKASSDFVPLPPRWVTVLGEDGKPVPGAEVVQSQDFGRPFVMVADAQGRVPYPGHVRPPIVLRARKGDHATEKAVSILDEREATIRVKPRTLGRIGGRVVDGGGKAMGGAVVTIYEQTGSIGSPVGNVLADAEGRWHFDQAWPDAHYSALASVPTYLNSLSQSKVIPKPGEETTLTIPPLTPLTGTAEGRVVDGKGNAIAGAVVSTESGTEAWAISDRHGFFRLEAMEERASVVVRDTAEREVRKLVRDGDRGLVFVMPDVAAEPTRRPDAAEMLVGKLAPSIAPTLWIDGENRSLASLKGKVVVLDFWGISCGPCVGALPGFSSFGRRSRIGTWC